jgi:hypothetical protein
VQQCFVVVENSIAMSSRIQFTSTSVHSLQFIAN